jgi:protein phosphatase
MVAAEPDHFLVGLGQSTGLERRHNEDALLVMVNNSAGEETMQDFGLFVVADGMGGHRSGEVASGIASRVVGKRLTANQQVVRLLPGGGTTLTAVVTLGEQLTVGHVGDSRAYVILDNEMKVITRDHTFVERLVEMGEVTQEEASSHPQRHVLYRAIGQGESLEVDVFTHPTPHGGMLLVCSDGLWGVVPDDKILNIVKKANHPQDACDELVRAANQGGGPDNITAVLVRFPNRSETEISTD